MLLDMVFPPVSGTTEAELRQDGCPRFNTTCSVQPGSLVVQVGWLATFNLRHTRPDSCLIPIVWGKSRGVGNVPIRTEGFFWFSRHVADNYHHDRRRYRRYRTIGLI